MKVIIGFITVLGCTLGGYVAMGGHLEVLVQPFEVVIICGSAVGAFITANPKSVLKGVMPGIKRAFKGPKYKKEHYIELLSVLFLVLKTIRSKGILKLESDIENPHDSELFKKFPLFQHDHHATDFLCDYLRMISLGSENASVMEDLMVRELEIHHQEQHQVAHAMQNVADGMPALGIVAAVLGVIKTMGAISEPPEVLGHLIGGALVGTFLGVWIAYGYCAPLASMMGSTFDQDGSYMEAIKAALIAHLQGNAPAISIEFARKVLPSHLKPSFSEIEQSIEQLPKN